MIAKFRVILKGSSELRAALRSAILKSPRYRIVGEASTGSEASTMLKSMAPNFAVIEVDPAERDAPDLVRTSGSARAETVLLMGRKDEALFAAAFACGVKGFVRTQSSEFEILPALDAAARGERFASLMFSTLLESHRTRSTNVELAVSAIAHLTATERRILSLIANSKSSREIAGALRLSAKTVENYRGTIAQKLNLRGSHSVLKFAVEHKFHL